jgi:hypothetical protein
MTVNIFTDFADLRSLCFDNVFTTHEDITTQFLFVKTLLQIVRLDIALGIVPHNSLSRSVRCFGSVIVMNAILFAQKEHLVAFE